MSLYTIRYSRKAKYLQIRLSLRGLEVVVPTRKRLANGAIEQFILQKQAWIEKNSRVVSEPQLPTTIQLHAINETWEIKYVYTSHQGLAVLTNPSKQITLMGNTSNITLCIEKLKRWLKQQAQHHLINELDLLSQSTGLMFNRVTIRNNLTRWGSCSSKKDINLCCKLLFLPQPLMRHVLLHELCHTKVMHHGAAFWQLLERYDNLTPLHRKEVNRVAKHLPSWIQ